MKTGQKKLHLISAFLIKQGNVIMSVLCHVSKMRKNVLAKWILLLDVLRQIFVGLKMRIVRPIHTIQNGVDKFCKIQNCTQFSISIPYSSKKKSLINFRDGFSNTRNYTREMGHWKIQFITKCMQIMTVVAEYTFLDYIKKVLPDIFQYL